MGLLDKMYEDSKYAAKERSKQNEINKKRAENERRRKEAEAKKAKEKKMREKNKPMSRGEKIGYTIFLCVLTLVSVPLSIYFSASLLNKLRKANGKDADLAGKLPADPESLPYKPKTRSQANATKASNDKSFSTAIDDSQKGGRRRKYQRGGNMVMNAANDAKGFTDSTKYGFPYSLAANDNPIIAPNGRLSKLTSYKKEMYFNQLLHLFNISFISTLPSLS